MSLYYDEARAAWRWQFKATIDGRRYRLSRLLPRGWSEHQARRYDEQETARTYARLATGKRVNEAPMIATAVGLYLRERVPTLRDSKHTAENLKHLLPEYKGRALDELGKISRQYASKQADTLSAATIRQRLATLRSAASYALKHHNIGSRDWIEQMPMPSVKNERHVYLRREEVLKLARACHDRGTRALVLLAFATGSRPGELHSAEPVGDAFLLPETKNGQRAMLPVPERFHYLMRHWPMRFGYTYYHARFRAARKVVGMDHVHLHDIRHSTASAMLSAGVGLHQVGQVLNHKTAQATRRYAHLYPEAKAAALATIWQKRPHKRSA